MKPTSFLFLISGSLICSTVFPQDNRHNRNHTYVTHHIDSIQSLEVIEEIDSRPLERPSFMFISKTSKGNLLLDSIERIIMTKGFEVENRDDDMQEMRVIRKSYLEVDGYEKILLWLERDFKTPDQGIKIYLNYGVYKKIFGKREYVRIKVTPETEIENIGDIKKLIQKININ